MRDRPRKNYDTPEIYAPWHILCMGPIPHSEQSLFPDTGVYGAEYDINQMHATTGKARTRKGEQATQNDDQEN